MKNMFSGLSLYRFIFFVIAICFFQSAILLVNGTSLASSNLSGDQGGNSNQASIVMSEPKSVAANFSATSQTGSIRVSVVPQEAANAGAQWKLTTESTWRNSGTIIYDLSLGTYYAEFYTITGWITPSNKEVTISVTNPDIWIDSDPYTRSTVTTLTPTPSPTPTNSFQVTNSLMTGISRDEFYGEYNGCKTPPEKNTFLDTDSQATVWFNFENSTSGDVFKWEWYKPGDVLYTQYSYTNTYTNGCWIQYISIKSGGAASRPGEWKAKVYRNDILLFTKTFTITDTTPPTVSSTSPANGATSVAVNKTISATFSEAMDSSTISTTTFTLSGGVTGSVSYDSTSKAATFSPSSNLSYSTTYTATITTGVKDSAGNAMSSNYSWSFTTTAATATPSPTPTPTTTDSFQVTNSLMTGISLDEFYGEYNNCKTPPEKNTFLDTDSQATVWFNYKNASQGDNFKWEWYEPIGNLYRSQETSYIWDGTSGCWMHYISIKSSSPASMPGEWKAKVYRNDILLFTKTFTITDTTLPTVSSTSPANGATSVAVNKTISATFSEAMDSSTISTTTFTLSGGVTGSVSYDSTSKAATFTPSSNLSYSTTYTATITTGVKDSAGNAMSSNYSWSFTTTAAPDATAPTGSVTINGGDSYTKFTTVTLNLSASDSTGMMGYYLSMNFSTPSASTLGWITVTTTTSYSADVSYSLSSGNGNKTVYVWYKDAEGNISDAANDSIILDTTAPTITITSPTSDSTYTTTSSTISLGGSASDSTSGLSSVTWSNSRGGSGTASGTIGWFISNIDLASGANTITVTAVDGAGNTGTGTITVTYETSTQTPTTTATPTPTPTLINCTAESIAVSQYKLELKRKETYDVTIAVSGEDDCPVEGEKVEALVNAAGKKSVTILPTSQETDENGEATFRITAKNKTGIARVTFSAGGFKKSITVKVKR